MTDSNMGQQENAPVTAKTQDEQQKSREEEELDELEEFVNPLDDFDNLEPDTPANGFGGHKRKFLDPKYLWSKCKEYFDKCDGQQLAYTIPGLAYHLGFISRQAIFYYMKRGDNCGKVIKAAKLKIEEQRNRQVVEGQGYMAGRIFDLKCNFGYNDQNPSGDGESQNTGGSQPQINVQQNFHGLPPQPTTLEEWTNWYQSQMKQNTGPVSAKKEPPPDESEDGEVINVSQSVQGSLESDD